MSALSAMQDWFEQCGKTPEYYAVDFQPDGSAWIAAGSGVDSAAHRTARLVDGPEIETLVSALIRAGAVEDWKRAYG